MGVIPSPLMGYDLVGGIRIFAGLLAEEIVPEIGGIPQFR
jgi:hypothetical protein